VSRPPLYPEPVRTHSVRTTDAQWEKFQALGGSVWLREQIIKARVPARPRKS